MSNNYKINLSNRIHGNGFQHSSSILTQRDCRKGFGDVYLDEKLIARVSWNGRVWNLDGSEMKLAVTQ